jgi:hypothetical protein
MEDGLMLLSLDPYAHPEMINLMMQMLDKKPADEPMTSVEEAPADYEAE